MKKYLKTIVASTVAGMVMAGVLVPHASAQMPMSNQQMMTQGGPAQGGAPGPKPGYAGNTYGMQGGGMGYYGPMGGAYGSGMPGVGCPMGMMGGMGGYGPGAGMMMGGGFGPGYGMGPGMMGDMGGFGLGAGMMGRGFGPGYGAGAPMAMMDLTDTQISQLEKIQSDGTKKLRALMRQMWDEQEKLGDLSRAEKRDPAAIGKAYARLAELQGQAMEIRIATENKASEVFTKEQQLEMRRSFGRGMMGY